MISAEHLWGTWCAKEIGELEFLCGPVGDFSLYFVPTKGEISPIGAKVAIKI